MGDLKLYETGNGGSTELKGSDLVVVDGFHNMIYIALFGGNYESTPTRRLPNEQSFDFWGNSFVSDRGSQFNSTTERALSETTLNSEGREIIQRAVLRDLEFMREFGTVTANVEISGVDQVKITIRIQEPDIVEAKEYVFLWDGTRNDFTDGENKMVQKISDSFSQPVCAPGIINIYDTFGNLIQTESIPSGQTENVYVDGAKNLILHFPFDAGDSEFREIEIKAGQDGLITAESQDGASGTITWKYNGGSYVAMSTLLPLTLSVGDTLQPKRTVATSDGYVELTGLYE